MHFDKWKKQDSKSTVRFYLHDCVFYLHDFSQILHSQILFTRLFRNRTEQDLVLGEECGGLQRDLRKDILIAVEVVEVGTWLQAFIKTPKTIHQKGEFYYCL